MKKILSWVILFSLFSFPCYSQSLTNLYDQEKAIDHKIVKSLRITVDKDQPDLGGMNEKFLVRDQLGRRWLFKMHKSIEQDVVGVVASEVANLIGVPVPQTYSTSFLINGEKRPGTLLQWIPNAKDLKKTPANLLSNAVINQIFQQQIYDYLMVNHDVRSDNFLLQQETGVIYGIDQDFAFDYWGENFPLVLEPNAEMDYYKDYYMENWETYTSGKSVVQFTPLLELISFIDQMDEELFKKIVKPAFEFPRVKKDVGSLSDYMKRKRGLKEAFLAYYQEARVMKGEVEPKLVVPPAENYTERVKEATKRRIAQKEKDLKELKLNIKGEQERFSLITSRKAWLYLVENEDKGPTILLTELRNILRKTTNDFERRAIKLYQAQIQKWDPHDPRNWDLKYEIRLP